MTMLTKLFCVLTANFLEDFDLTEAKRELFKRKSSKENKPFNKTKKIDSNFFHNSRSLSLNNAAVLAN